MSVLLSYPFSKIKLRLKQLP